MLSTWFFPLLIFPPNTNNLYFVMEKRVDVLIGFKSKYMQRFQCNVPISEYAPCQEKLTFFLVADFNLDFALKIQEMIR